MYEKISSVSNHKKINNPPYQLASTPIITISLPLQGLDEFCGIQQDITTA